MWVCAKPRCACLTLPCTAQACTSSVLICVHQRLYGCRYAQQAVLPRLPRSTGAEGCALIRCQEGTR